MFATAINKISYQIYEESVIFQRIADYVNRMVHLADYAKDIRLTGIFHVMQKKHEKSVKGMTDIIDSYKKKSILYGWAYMFLTYSAIFEGVLFYGVYRTLVSESMTLAEGVVLSGGECQKLIAARAFMEDKPIMVFDEPSSALDPIAESQLFESIRKAKEGKILFFISHRLSSVQGANQIFVLRNGRIVERGTHQELMEAKGEYEKMYQMQAKNYQEDLGKAW